MSQMLLELVLSENPQLFQKYINKYLSNDPADLQRIYHELQSYYPQKQQHRQSSAVKMRKEKPKKLSYQDKHSYEYINDKSRKLLLDLKDKGLRPNYEFGQGLTIFEKKKKTLTNPLQQNQSTKFTQKAKIDQLFETFHLNRQFYNNQIQNTQFTLENVHDVEMKRFLIKRQELLNQIKHNKLSNLQQFKKPQKYNSVGSKIFKSAATLPTLTQSALKQRKKSETKQLMAECSSYLKNKVKQVQGPNYFQELERKLEPPKNEHDQLTQVKKERIRYDRYTHSYMRMMNNSEKKVKKCKMSQHEKDLLKDELRLRKVLGIVK